MTGALAVAHRRRGGDVYLCVEEGLIDMGKEALILLHISDERPL